MSISGNSFKTFTFQISSLLLSTLSSIIITRALGPESKGIYTLVFITVLTIMDFIRLNIDASTIYFIGQGKNRIEEFVGNFVLLTLTISFISIIVYGLSANLICSHFVKIDIKYLRIVFFVLPLFLFQMYISNIIWGINDIFRFNLIRIVQPVSLVILSVVAVFFFNTVGGFIVVNILSVIISISLGLFYLRSYMFKMTINLLLLKNMLVFGVKGAISNILMSIIYRFGCFMVSYKLGMEAMGFYSIALLAELLWYIPYSVDVAINPILNSNKISSDKAFLTSEICRHSLTITLLCVIIMIPFSGYLIPLLYGKSFSPAVLPFCILLFGAACGSIAKPLRSYFNGIGRPEIQTYISFIVLIITPLLYINLIRWIGLPGAAISATIIQSTATMLLVIQFTRLTNTKLVDILIIKKNDIIFYKNLITRYYAIYFRGAA